MKRGTRFSQIQALDLDLDDATELDAQLGRLTLAQLFRALFGTADNEPRRARHQITSLSVYCDSTMKKKDFEALCSALVANQTTRDLHLRLNMEPNSQVRPAHWWKWLAYRLFSKQARTLSKLETLTISGLHSMSVADMNAFVKVLKSDQRFRSGDSATDIAGLRSLTVEFYEHTKTGSDGLPQFISLVGASLGSLTIEGTRVEVGVEHILQWCPNLKELSFCGSRIDVQLEVASLRASHQRTSTFSWAWNDVRALSRSLSEVAHPLSTSDRRLRVRLSTEAEAMALLQMLGANQFLEFIQVILPSPEYARFATRFRQHHQKPICRASALSAKHKAAFLTTSGPSYKATSSQVWHIAARGSGK